MNSCVFVSDLIQTTTSKASKLDFLLIYHIRNSCSFSMKDTNTGLKSVKVSHIWKLNTEHYYESCIHIVRKLKFHCIEVESLQIANLFCNYAILKSMKLKQNHLRHVCRVQRIIRYLVISSHLFYVKIINARHVLSFKLQLIVCKFPLVGPLFWTINFLRAPYHFATKGMDEKYAKLERI